MMRPLLFTFVLTMGGCVPMQRAAFPQTASPNNPCVAALGPSAATAMIGGAEHSLICVPLRLSYSDGLPIEGVKPAVRVNVFNKTDYLVNVSSFKAVPGNPGLYAGRVPVNDHDELLAYSMFVQAEAMLEARSNLVKFSRSMLVAPEVRVTMIRDLSNRGVAWRPVFDASKIRPEILAWIKASEPVQFLPLRGNKTTTVGDLAENFTHQQLDDNREFVLAKAAPLNIYFELDLENQIPNGGSSHWINRFGKLLSIGQERILVEVKEDMLGTLKDQISGPDVFSCGSYHPASGELHGRNFGLVVRPQQVLDVASGKMPECRGNLHLTVGSFRAAGTAVTVADIDFDDNYSFAAHAADVVDHWVHRTGTNPILIYEYLRTRYPNAELGYSVQRVR